MGSPSTTVSRVLHAPAGRGVRPKPPSAAARTIAAIVVCGAFSSTLLERYVASLQILVPLAALFLIVVTLPRVRPPVYCVALGPPLVLWVMRGLGWHAASGNALGNLSELLSISPLCALAGAGIAGSAQWRRAFTQSYLLAAIAASLLAVYEHARSARLIRPQFNFEYNRASVFVQHPIVLGIMLVLAMTMTGRLSRRSAILGGSLLLVGILSTGSSGPTGVGVAVFIVILFPGVGAFVGRHASISSGLVVAFGAAVAIASTSVWSNALNDNTNDQYDTQYRFALYSFLPRMLENHPFGYGASGMPYGVYIIYSHVRGPVDAARTLDAEPVLLASQIGILGLAVFVWSGVFAARMWRDERGASFALLALLACGLTAALHAWAELTAIWSALIGGLTVMRANTVDDSSSAVGRITTGRAQTCRTP